MRQLREVTAVHPGRESLVWFHHVVRPLLRPPGAVGAAHADCARGHAALHSKAQGGANQSASAAGCESNGRVLSRSEMAFYRYQANVKYGRSRPRVVKRALGCFVDEGGIGCELSPEERAIAKAVRHFPLSWEA